MLAAWSIEGHSREHRKRRGDDNRIYITPLDSELPPPGREALGLSRCRCFLSYCTRLHHREGLGQNPYGVPCN
jgi:hypothetical protein